LSIFIEIICTGNTSLLGNGEHKLAWEKIRSEYAEITNDIEYINNLQVLRDLNLIDNRIKIIHSTVDLMRKYYVPKLGEILDYYGYSYDWLVNEETYQKQLDIIISKSKTFTSDLVNKREEWQKIVSKSNESGGISELVFVDTLLQLSHMQGYHIKTSEITVMEFARLINLAKKYNNGSRTNK
jgi:hypothetical protein